MSQPDLFSIEDSPDGDAGGDRSLPKWLGLETSHRRLFDAGQDGWLRPRPGRCFVLGHERFVSEEFPAGRNVVPVRLAFDVSRLPFPGALTHLEGGAAGNDDGGEPRTVFWRAPIPLFAVKTIETPTDEQKTRLLAMADQLSNVSLPDTAVAVTDFAVDAPPTGVSATWETQSLELPEELDAIQGAMAMAVWAVPHVEPWIEILQQALNRDAAGVAAGIGRLDAQWLQLPWLVDNPSGPARDDADDLESLWRAALHCVRWSTREGESPAALAERIAEAAGLGGKHRSAETWLERTRRIVAAEESIACDAEREGGPGLAIRLALLRPDPTRFRSWNKDLPGLPPGVWWAAAILCGWRHGYRTLDREFRGDAGLQEFLATRALEASWRGDDSAALPPSQRAPLERTREEGCYALTWRGHHVVRKEWKSRAKWYDADLTDIATSRVARDLAGRLGWACIERHLPLPEGRVETLGGGGLSINGDALVVEGEKSLRLPKGVDVEERIDTDEFRRLLATEAGDLDDPPGVALRQPVPEVVPDPRLADFRQPAVEVGVLRDSPEETPEHPASEIPGLIYRPDFITEDEETELLKAVDGAEWSTELQRRVQQYGWCYNYKERRIDESVRVPEFPDWARKLGRKLVDDGLMKVLPDQLIVNEYLGKQGITPHTDHAKDFTERIATISLLETWVMNFQRGSRGKKRPKHLERRSVAVLTGDARYEWKHEIPQRKSEPPMDGMGKRIPRCRRISLTFRTTRFSPDV